MEIHFFVGARVLRGPDWDQGDSDGGEGYLGTVTQLLGNGRVRVVWDKGAETICRVGGDEKYDLRLFDTAPSGVRHKGTKCSACGQGDIWSMLWRCQQCTGCDLCTFCYSDDKHEINHRFIRIDRPGDVGQILPVRKISVKVRAIGIFPGAKVIRGRDWMWDDQDGGQSSEGDVEGYEPEAVDSWRNLIRVRWPNGVVNSYRLGFQGKVDLLCVEEETGPFYYRDHLPLLDITQREATTKENTSQGSRPSLVLRHPEPHKSGVENVDTVIRNVDVAGSNPSARPTAEAGADKIAMGVGVGDHVTITVNEQQLETLQKDFGGCTPGMIKSIGNTGEVTSITRRGAVCVRFGPTNRVSYRFNPAAVIKLQKFEENDIVRVTSSKDLTQLFNRKIGWKPEMDETMGKVGRVRKVDHEGNILVEVEGQLFLYSPACCLHETAESVTSHREETVKQEMTSAKTQPAVTVKNMDLKKMARDHVADSGTPDRVNAMHRLFAAIKNDDDRKVKEMCLLDPNLVECEYTGITPLILALYEGRRKCVRVLLELGADVSRCVSDDSDKTPMSAALEGKNEDLVELLLELGANKEHWYSPGVTAIHLAIKYSLVGAVLALAKHGADVNRKHLGGKTPIHMAIELKKTDIVEALLSLPEVDIEIEDDNSFNALQLACLRDNPRAVELILKRDKSGVNKRRKGDSTPLHIAAYNDHVECVRLLVINGGADVNMRNKRKNGTALHNACLTGKFATAEALLELGADVNVVDADGDTPLHLAIGGKIENYGQGDSAEVEITCRVQLSNMLISAGAFVDARDQQGRTPLTYGHPAVREGVKMFIKNNRSAVKFKTEQGSGDFSPPVFGGQDNLEEKLKRVGVPCGLCGHPKSDVTLYPCQHKCVCSGCSVAVTCCPLCDEPVKEKINTGPDDEVYDLEKKFNLM
ncbi:E3 ubiquitin-protein ligase MIB1-like isoform X2 [Pomacea canaliculata]|uniref:E3 ubiquitin-protein ligase MIB1-like isoform X2 n=1 Tax=Pomacea canaliculata TaxID=400727 RepID=UPI000D728191|nr:E3 ubiquitin-protein ligase MIB1-like isoform X2 [Pomacea canaliculata]